MEEDPQKAEELDSKKLQEAIEALDPLKNVQDLAALAAEMLAQDGMSTKWDDILPMLEDQDSEKSNLVYNTMLMMDAVEVANLKGYLPNLSKINFTRIKGRTSSIKTAIKKEKIIDTIRELAQKNPDKRITWLRKKASSILSNKGQKGYSYRQILRDTKGLKIK